MATIVLDEVSVRLGERDALAGVSLTLVEHRVALVGSNGSGKSTLARLINGLVLPTAGAVSVDGLDTRRSGADIRRRVGFVFTDPDAQVVMPTVGEDVEFSLRRLRLGAADRRDRVSSVLRRFGLDGFADASAHLLSGGQKQLLALASVLVTEPDVLVCDEPTTLLDLHNSSMVADLLAGLPQQVVLVTHDLALAATYGRVVVLDAGRVVADGAAGTSLDTYRALVG